MKTLEELHNLSIEALQASAKSLGIANPPSGKEELIQSILSAQGEQSEFFSDEPQSEFYTDEEVSEFYEASIFIGGEEQGRKPDPLKLKSGDQITLNEKSYEIKEIISENSLEAVIYKVENEQKQARVVKLYYPSAGARRGPNHLALELIHKINDKDVLRLFDFGTGKQMFAGRHSFEISEYAEGGDLLSVTDFKKKYSYSFIKNTLVPELFKGVQSLHQVGIIHCDLKPGNIFFKNKGQSDLVIGDYGSAKVKDQTEELGMVSQVIGTKYYLPPEQGRLIISEKNDYYSIGMILIHLLYPEKFCKEGSFTRVDPKKYQNIVLGQYENRDIIEFDPQYGELNELIIGLTYANPKERWGEEEVRRWMNGEEQFVASVATEELVTAPPLPAAPKKKSNWWVLVLIALVGGVFMLSFYNLYLEEQKKENGDLVEDKKEKPAPPETRKETPPPLEEEPNEELIRADIKTAVFNYYSACKMQDYARMTELCKPVIDTFYASYNVNFDALIPGFKTYYKKWAPQSYSVDWASLKVKEMPGGYFVSYNLTYLVSRISTGEIKEFPLTIFLTMDPVSYKVSTIFEKSGYNKSRY